jgi:aryl-alcohol dehydrogenase-like predicted oxidoreductase
VKKCDEVANKLKCTTSQLALAWVLSRGDNVCIIPGTTKLANLESNMQAAELLSKLNKDDLDLLSSIGSFTGERYSWPMTYKALNN